MEHIDSFVAKDLSYFSSVYVPFEFVLENEIFSKNSLNTWLTMFSVSVPVSVRSLAVTGRPNRVVIRHDVCVSFGLVPFCRLGSFCN